MASDYLSGLYNYNPLNAQLQGSLPQTPDEAIYLFESNFSSIFRSFLSDSDTLNESEDDEFSSLSSYTTQANYLTGSNNDLTQLELLNKSSSLIGKKVDYWYNGTNSVGQIESVVYQLGSVYFMIDETMIPISSVTQISEG